MVDLSKELCAYPLLEFTPELPSDAEASSAREQLEIAEAELQRLDYEHSRHLSYRAHVEDRIHRCQSLIAPYKKLPAELIAEIIRLCVPDSAVLPLECGKYDPHLQMTQICTTWRNVAFSMPTLWRVRISRGPKGSIRLVDAWFRQSSGSQLVLTMPDSRIKAAQSNAVLTDIIIPHATRFRSLGPLMVTTRQWNLIGSLPFKSLETLYIDPRLFGEGSTRPIGLLPTPALQKFHLEGISGGENKLVRLPALPWSQLTSLCLTGDPVGTNLFEVLEQCTSLERCKIHYLSSRSLPTPLPGTFLRLPHLKSMSVSNSHSLCDLLPLFVLPGLSSFEIDEFPLDEEPRQQFLQFLRSVSVALRSFAISTAPPWYKEVDEDFISAVPFVTEFSLPRRYGFNMSTLLKIGNGELLPRIERLQFYATDRVKAGAVLESWGSQPSSTTSPLRKAYILYNDRYSIFY